MQRLRYLESKNFNILTTERNYRINLRRFVSILCLFASVCLFVCFFFTFSLILGVHGEFAAKNALLGQNSEHGQLRFLKGAAVETARHLG